MASKIDKYDKKVQSEINSFIQKRKESWGNNCFTEQYLMDIFNDNFISLSKISNTSGLNYSESELEKTLRKTLHTWTHRIKFDLYNYIFYERIINDNFKVFHDGLFTIQRYLFLSDKYYPNGNSDVMINLRSGLAVYDKELVNSYLSQTPGPFESGYSFYTYYANSLYFILEDKLEKSAQYLEEKINKKSLRQYERSILLCIKAIANKDEDVFDHELNNLLKLYPKQKFYNNLADYINIEAIGLFNLAEKVWSKTIVEPDSEYWDSEFISYSRKNEAKLLDLSKISLTIDKWLKELPKDISLLSLVKNLPE